MDFVLILLAVGFLIFAANKMGHSSVLKPLCKLHQWDRDAYGYICKVCNRRPADIDTDYDKPY